MPRIHHIASGDSTTALIARAGLPGTRSVWADILHEGPVPARLGHEELCGVRARYLAKAGYGSYEEISASFREWRAPLDRPTYDELVLWFEHDLFDQLNLIQLLDRLLTRPGVAPISIVSIDAFPGREQFRGMGELEPAEIASLFPARSAVTDPQLELGSRAWAGFRAATVTDLESLLSSDTSALPFLAPALQRHLEEFPSPTTGLSRTEQRLLELVAGGEHDIRRLFPRMHDHERYFFIGDSSFWTVVLGLATSVPALMDVKIEALSNGALPRGSVQLTTLGRDVLHGRVNRLTVCGFDRWLGGVHLLSPHS